MHITKRLVRQRLGPDATGMVNTLSGAIDVFTDAQLAAIDHLSGDEPASQAGPDDLLQYLRDRAYLFESEQAEDEAFRTLRESMRVLEQKEPTLFGICPTYFCFFKCAYCYEGELTSQAHHSDVT
jgi:uncharacterized protein